MFPRASTSRSARLSRLPLPSRRLLATAAAVLLSVSAFSLLAAQPASAHAKLEETSPPDGRTLDSPPSAVSLTFNEPMLNFGVTVRVTGPNGSVTDGKATIKGAVVTQALNAGLPSGAYKVQWRVASKDGHPISGASTFRVAAADPTPQADPTTEAPTAAAPTPTATPLTTPAPTGGDDASEGTALPTVLAAGVGVLAVGTAAVLAFARRRRTVDRS
jgi:methionine-rich copper-binding protein CopC